MTVTFETRSKVFSFVSDSEQKVSQMQPIWIPTLVSTISWIIPITASSSPRVKLFNVLDSSNVR